MMNHHQSTKGLIIMTPTSIITADGDRFIREGRAKRAIIRIAILLGLIFLSAAIIGMGKAALAPAHTEYRPSPANFAILHRAQAANPTKECYLEWNEIQGDHEVICK
jgi:hypothetical protein